jgi:hypothetical protein
MFTKICVKCGSPATVEMDGQYLCTNHAFDKIVAAKSPVQIPRRVK